MRPDRRAGRYSSRDRDLLWALPLRAAIVSIAVNLQDTIKRLHFSNRRSAYFEEDPRLRHQENLPSSPARLKIAVSLRRLGERIRMFQPQLQRPLCNPLQYLTGTNL
jgi:hypothetical protein